MLSRLSCLAALCLATLASGAPIRAFVSVSHGYSGARPGQVISVSLSDLSMQLPGIPASRWILRDSRGQTVPFQAAGASVLFVHDFAVKESSAVFTIEAEAAPSAPKETGPADDSLAVFENGYASFEMVADGTLVPKGRPLPRGAEASASKPEITAATGACGALGVWTGNASVLPSEFKSVKRHRSGPLQTTLEITFAPYEAAGLRVSEVRRISVTAGSPLYQVESRFTYSGAGKLAVAVDLGPETGNQQTDTFLNPAAGIAGLWRSTGPAPYGFGIVFPEVFGDTVVAQGRRFLIRSLPSGGVVRYSAGVLWSDPLRFPYKEAWVAFLTDANRLAKFPLRISFTAPEAPSDF